MYLCTFFVTITLIAFLGMEVAIWATLDFSPYYSYIERCMDLGGVWNDQIKDCEGSEMYNQWKQRS